MLELHAAGDLSALARQLGAVLAVRPADPMASDLVAVPSAGMRTWLSLQLARRLGAGRSDASEGGLAPRADGVSANILFPFPGILRRRVLEAWTSDEAGSVGAGEPADPWSVEHLVWSILEVADSVGSGGIGEAGGLPRPLLDATTGTSRYAAARQVADLFDRYHLHRPAMVEAWRAGTDLDGVGGELSAHQRWQPALWRELRHHLGVPGPPERLEHLLECLRLGDLPVDLPERVCVFGVSSLPGGPGFIDLAAALASTREVHLFLVEPSSLIVERVEAAAARSPSGAAAPWYRLRADVDTAGLLHHPLLRSWGRVHCETASVLTDARRAGALRRVTIDTPGARTVSTLLGRLQADIRADRTPAGDLLPGDLGPSDGRPTTIEFHACHGPARQVEVLHDTILRLLNDHPHLQEDDVLVVCPALESFAPVVEAVFGRSARVGGAVRGGAELPPALRYQLADRSLGVAAPLVGAVRQVLDLVAGRFDAPALLDFLSLAPVRLRFGLDEDALALLAQWVAELHIRFGLDAGSRAEWGIPASVITNTWEAGIDRLLLGAAVRGGRTEVFVETVGQVVPHDVEGSDVVVAGRLADVLHRLGELARLVGEPRDLKGWLDLLAGTVAQLFEVPRDEVWQIDRLMRTLGDIDASADRDGRRPTTPLTLDDIRRVLDERVHDPELGRPSFFRGGITISSLTPLRWVPHKVVVMLGMDAPALAGSGADGDDLTVLAPLVGDRDRRSELRQSLLETVLSAEEHVVVIRDGHDVRTNQEIPMAVPVAELRDAVLAMVHPDHRRAVGERIEVHHPRQAFAESYFCDTPDDRGAGGGPPVPGPPRSFDVGAASVAEARRRRAPRRAGFLEAPLDPVAVGQVDLAELHRVLRNPIRYFVERRLELRLPRDGAVAESTIPTKLEPLDRWALAEQLLDLRTRRAAGPNAGDDTHRWEAAAVAEVEAAWRTAATRTGSVPPGRLGDKVLDDAAKLVAAICHAAAEEGVLLGPVASRASVDVAASDGTTVTGQIDLRLREGAGERGPALVTCSRRKSAHRLSVWLDLAVLTLTDPTTSWRAVVATRHESRGGEDVTSYRLTEGDQAALARRVLDTVVDLHRRALCEPLPLFSAVSESLWRHPDTAPDWPGRYPDAAEKLVYGLLSPTELCELPLRPLDPPGSTGDRARRYAEHLYGSLAATLEVVER